MTKKRRVLLGTVVLVGFISQATLAATWIVDNDDTNCSDPSDCSGGTSSAPFCTIQKAIDCASSGDTVTVRPGNDYSSFKLTSIDLVIAGDTSGISRPEVDGNIIVENGQSRSAEISGFELVSANLIGIIIRNGSNVTIRDMIIHDRTHGIYITDSSPRILYTEIYDCQTESGFPGPNGAGILALGCIRDSTSLPPLDLEIDRCNIHDNDTLDSSGGNGGGVFIESGELLASPLITNSKIMQNTAGASGGGIYIQAVAILSTICHGSKDDPLVTPRIENTIIAENVASRFGGGGVITTAYVEASFKNCTIVYNVADDDGGGYFGLFADSEMCNTIVWFNDATRGEEIALVNANLDGEYNFVDEVCEDEDCRDRFYGDGGSLDPWTNINCADAPKFIDPNPLGIGDYRQKTSPCSPTIDVGTGDCLPEDDYDCIPDEDDRVMACGSCDPSGTIIDVGADEADCGS